MGKETNITYEIVVVSENSYFGPLISGRDFKIAEHRPATREQMPQNWVEAAEKDILQKGYDMVATDGFLVKRAGWPTTKFTSKKD